MDTAFVGGLTAVGVSALVALRQTQEARKLYNIVWLGFFEKLGPGHDRFDQAQTTTLFRFAQYFGWTEILRRDIQFLSFPKADDTKNVTALQADVARALADSKPWTKEQPKSGETLMIWVDEQRAIGERMIVVEHEKVMCMGYARFCDEYEKCFQALFERARAVLLAAEAVHRLTEAQHLLSDLVRALDSDRDRYTRDLDQA